MKGHGEKLNRNQERAIAALLVHPTMSQAASAVGIGEVTLWRWMQIPEFKEQCRLARSEAVSQAVGHLQGACSVAVVALRPRAKAGMCSNCGKPLPANLLGAKRRFSATIKTTKYGD